MTLTNVAGAERRLSFISKTCAVVRKDGMSEFRTRYALNSALLFCVTCVFVVSFAVKGTVQDTRIVSAMLWVILFFSAMTGLSRAFIKEEDQGTMNLLRLSCEPGPLFFGKFLVNFLLLLAVVVIATPLFFIMMNVAPGNPAFLCAALLPASAAMSAICTLVSAIIAGARARGMLFPILAFPVLLPVFWVAVDATDIAMSARGAWQHSNMLLFLGCYAVAGVVGGSFLFEYIFEE